jgi:hypothetical protein
MCSASAYSSSVRTSIACMISKTYAAPLGIFFKADEIVLLAFDECMNSSESIDEGPASISFSLLYLIHTFYYVKMVY